MAGAFLLVAHIKTREPNQSRYTYNQRSGRFAEDIPAPRVSPHGGRISVPTPPARMPHTLFYDRNYAMSGRENWHLYGAHSVVVPGASSPRGEMVGFLRRRPIQRDVPRAYGSQVPVIQGEE